MSLEIVSSDKLRGLRASSVKQLVYNYFDNRVFELLKIDPNLYSEESSYLFAFTFADNAHGGEDICTVVINLLKGEENRKWLKAGECVLDPDMQETYRCPYIWWNMMSTFPIDRFDCKGAHDYDCPNVGDRCSFGSSHCTYCYGHKPMMRASTLTKYIFDEIEFDRIDADDIVCIYKN